mmetsp:Transcript_57233/g.145366  ORF Transcript_57233/g.145366 Transcript_57233/m.145366 type:complete len:201 (-) Transcript_57233:136-738(-)
MVLNGLLAEGTDHRHVFLECDDVLTKIFRHSLLIVTTLEGFEHFVRILELVVHNLFDLGCIQGVQWSAHPLLGGNFVLDCGIPQVVQRLEFLGDLLEFSVVTLLGLKQSLSVSERLHSIFRLCKIVVQILDPLCNRLGLLVVVKTPHPLEFFLVFHHVLPELLLLSLQLFHELDFFPFQVALSFCDGQLDRDRPLEGEKC